MTAVARTALVTGRWENVASLTGAAFTARNLGVKRVRGTVPVRAAWVDVDAGGNPHAVGAELDLTAIETGNRRRDEDLRKPHLLDTAKHPILTFTGAAPEPAADGWIVAGRLAGRAATDVTLRAQVVRRNADGELAVHATTTVDRRALGVRAPRFLIGRWLQIEVTAAFRPPR